jgi:hypothetical protein
MKAAFCLRRHHRGAAVGVILIMTALVILGPACDDDGNGAGTYQLAVSSASGGSVTTPGAGTFTYEAGAVVQLVAAPDDGYQFHLWTGDVTYVTNPNTASTSITMNGDCALVANFEIIEGETGPDDGGSTTPSGL